MKKNPEQTDQTRRHIVDAFWKLYESRPIERITVKEVVAHAGCNRSTFYVYFDSVYEVLEYIEGSVLDEIAAGLKDAPENPTYEDVLRHHLATFEKEWKYLAVLISENGDPSFTKKIRILFEQSLQKKSTSRLSDDRISYITEYTAGGLSFIMTKWLSEKRAFPFEELIFITHVFKEAEAKLLNGEIEYCAPSPR